MSCFFALLGAQVRGVDIDEAALEKAEVEAKRWKVEDRLIFQGYGGDPGEISGEDYDFVFTKSVLVVVPQLKSFLARLGDKVRVGGELLAVENLEGNAALNFFRRTVIHRRWNSFEQKFWGVDEDFTSAFAPTFTVAEQKNFFWLVAAIRAIKQIETTSKTIQSS